MEENAEGAKVFFFALFASWLRELRVNGLSLDHDLYR